MISLGRGLDEVGILQDHEGVCNYPNVACRKKRDIICEGCQKNLGSWGVYAELFKGPEVQILWEDANYEDESLGPVDRERSQAPASSSISNPKV